MNQTTTRTALAAIAAFYVVIGGLWAINYFPLKGFYHQVEVKDAIISKLGYPAALSSVEYKAAEQAQATYALSHPDILVTEGRVAFYKSLLIWGTVAIGVGGGVLFLTRSRGGQAAKGAAQ